MRCYWFNVAISESPEGDYVRGIHPEINFTYCKHKCDGLNQLDCPNFRAKIRAERVERIGRLESLGELILT